MSSEIAFPRNSWVTHGDLPFSISDFDDERSEASASQPVFDDTIPGMVNSGIQKRLVKREKFGVVCMDDDQINTKISEIAFKSLGILSFFRVHSMDEFRELFDRQEKIPPVDVFLLDYNLDRADTSAGFTGYEVAQQIRQIWNRRNLEQPFLVSFSSAFGTFSSAKVYSGKNFSEVFDEVLQKPMTHRQIKQFLEEHYEFSPPLKNQPDPVSRQLVTERRQNRYEVTISPEPSELLSCSSQPSLSKPPSPLSPPQSLPLGQELPQLSSSGVAVNENESSFTSSIGYKKHCPFVCYVQ